MQWPGFKSLRLADSEFDKALSNDLRKLDQYVTEIATRVGRLIPQETVSNITTTYVTTSSKVIAGAGLTGGGTLTSDVTLDVGAGSGLTVGADSISVDESFPFVWTGAHEFDGGSYTFNSPSVTFQSGIDLDVSGRIDSHVTDVAGHAGITLQPTTNFTDGTDRYIIRMLDFDSSNLLTFYADKTGRFGYDVTFDAQVRVDTAVGIRKTATAAYLDIYSPGATTPQIGLQDDGGEAFINTDNLGDLTLTSGGGFPLVIVNSPLDLSSHGKIRSSVGVTPGSIVFDMVDTQDRSGSPTEILWRLSNEFSGQPVGAVNCAGWWAFGYGVGTPNFGTQLGFFSTDVAPFVFPGFPVSIGVLSSIQHQSGSTETQPFGPYGVIGNSAVSLATGLTGNLQAGTLGDITLGPAAGQNFVGKEAACFSGVLTRTAVTANLAPAALDPAFGKGSHPSGNYNRVGFLRQPVWSANASGSYPALADLPGAIYGLRVGIQDWGASITAGSPQGKLLAIMSDTVNGSVVMRPTETGWAQVTYPRRTAEATTRAYHQWWEPWPNTSTTRGNAVKGDLYFDDGTNFRIGMWEYDGTNWYKLLQHKSVDAISGAGGAATLAANTGGATGPTTAAQNTWLKVVGVNGTAYWVPAWV